MEQESKGREAENLAEASTKMQSSGTNNMETENCAEASSKAQSSQKGTPKLLKARSKVIKKSADSNSLRPKNAKSTPQLRGKDRKKKNKSVLLGKEESSKNDDEVAKNLNSKEETIQSNVASEKRIEKDQEIQNNKERITRPIKGSKKQKSKKKRSGSENSSRNHKNRLKFVGKEKRQRDEKKKEKLGGLIFMCSAKTKPDCFHYRVMGVTMNKKDLVLDVKPGLKLFLYDFDLKLMYGIYQASSSGGVKLEPKAFGGSFPAQVRFSVYKDCFPIPESLFKKAIKDNYNENNKFKTELTVQQVRKLSKLFRPAVFQSPQSSAVPIRSPRRATTQDWKVYEAVRESRIHSDREAFAITNHDIRSYPVFSHERDHRTEFQELRPLHREENPRDLYMSEKEYRTYGLKGERRNLTPPHYIASALDQYQRDQKREHLLGQPDLMYRDALPLQRETVISDPHYLTQREFHNYGVRHELPPATPSITAPTSGSAITALDPYTRDQYYSSYYGASSMDAHLLAPRREEVSSGSYYTDGRRESYLLETDPLRRREADQVDKLYSVYAADRLSGYNQVHHYHGAKPEAVPPPVSSRYSFAGPSVSYRKP